MIYPDTLPESMPLEEMDHWQLQKMRGITPEVWPCNIILINTYKTPFVERIIPAKILVFEPVIPHGHGHHTRGHRSHPLGYLSPATWMRLTKPAPEA